MRKRFAVVPIAAAIALVALPSGASAATEIGNVCEANQVVGSDLILAQVKNASSALPQTSPITGVLTNWKIHESAVLPDAWEEQLKVLRPAGSAGEFKVVGESSLEKPTLGAVSSFAARIPIKAGDLLGVYSPPGGEVLDCATSKPEDVGLIHPHNLLTTDAADKFVEPPDFRAPVAATVEPDVDGDGFGDETQDKCPQSAAFQAECPQIGLEDFASVGKGAITMLVIADHEAPVTVTATTKGGKSPKRHPLKGGVLLKGGTQTVKPNQLAKFKLKFSKPLKAALGALPKGKSLTLTITASATNLVGQQFTKTTTLKLKG